MNGENFPLHPIINEQIQYCIHIQLLNNQIRKTFYAEQKKTELFLPLDIWKKQSEKITKFVIYIVEFFILIYFYS